MVEVDDDGNSATWGATSATRSTGRRRRSTTDPTLIARGSGRPARRAAVSPAGRAKLRLRARNDLCARLAGTDVVDAERLGGFRGGLNLGEYVDNLPAGTGKEAPLGDDPGHSTVADLGEHRGPAYEPDLAVG